MRNLSFKYIFLIFFILGAAIVFIIGVVPIRSHVGQHTLQRKSRQVELKILPISYECKYCIDDVAILPDKEWWAVGYDSHDPRKLWHSTDGGDNWETVIAPTGGWTLSNIYFVDQKNGWAAGSGNFIIRTTNGGNSWERLKLPVYLADSQMNFVNVHVGYIAGAIGTENSHTGISTFGIQILKTNDGGKTWRTCYKDADSINVFSIATLSEKVVLLTSNGDKLLRTEDGGTTWQIVRTDQNRVYHATFSPDGTGWLVGFKGAFYKSTDAGKTWAAPAGLPPGFATHNWWSIDFTDKGVGMAVGEDCAIAITYDGGNTWSEIKSNLHEGRTIKANGFDESLRQLHLHPSGGIIDGSQWLYRIDAFE